MKKKKRMKWADHFKWKDIVKKANITKVVVIEEELCKCS